MYLKYSIKIILYYKCKTYFQKPSFISPLPNLINLKAISYIKKKSTMWILNWRNAWAYNCLYSLIKDERNLWLKPLVCIIRSLGCQHRGWTFWINWWHRIVCCKIHMAYILIHKLSQKNQIGGSYSAETLSSFFLFGLNELNHKI
jgi:hypothetical protein